MDKGIHSTQFHILGGHSDHDRQTDRGVVVARQSCVFNRITARSLKGDGTESFNRKLSMPCEKSLMDQFKRVLIYTFTNINLFGYFLLQL